MLAKKIEKRLLLVVVLMIGLHLVVQFIILGTVGTTGPDISRIRTEREAVEMNNKVKTAAINDLQTNAKVVVSVTTEMEMQAKALNYLQDPDQKLFASSR